MVARPFAVATTSAADPGTPNDFVWLAVVTVTVPLSPAASGWAALVIATDAEATLP